MKFNIFGIFTDNFLRDKEVKILIYSGKIMEVFTGVTYWGNA